VIKRYPDAFFRFVTDFMTGVIKLVTMRSATSVTNRSWFRHSNKLGIIYFKVFTF